MAAYVTRREKDILKVILAAQDKKMSTTQLKARAGRDLYIAVSSVHAMCYALVKRGFLEVVDRIKGHWRAGRLQCVWKLTPKGEEYLQCQ